ncbi:MAG: helix-turn-helix transcriptional regulator [Oscillospiraceae bacterium]|nr:helix-turn-helix transcriptional regulator [Oscillospiraceae bacterium]
MYQRIKDLREDADLSQRQIAEKLNCSQQTYSNYETGARTIPPEFLILLARFHNTSVDYLLGLTDQKSPDAKR